MKNIQFISLLVIALILMHCKKDRDPNFLINNSQVGKLMRTSPVSELENIYSNDSIVKDTSPRTLVSNSNMMEIYEKGGQHLLTLTPNEDSIPKIGIIRVLDPRFKTEKGIGLESTFKEIKDKCVIKKIVTSLNNVIIFIENSDVYFTIDKDELPASLRYDTSINIEEVQIPDDAKIKYIMVGWD
ncbi:hypothetical protein [Eudoraea sp.]|uniref:hypothetical protein n=1 Tax=Eudoraea sp. TaxID=1979955 RepID=UPI003C722A48